MQLYMITNTATLKAHEWIQQYKFHLVLAQVLSQDSKYFNLVKTMIKGGVHVILDNGAHEGVVCNLSDYYKVILELRPEWVVLPDLIGVHAIESRTRSLVFYEWLCRQDWPIPSIVYVPQGLCQQEVVDEFLWGVEYFNERPHRTRIGVGDAYKYCYTSADVACGTPPEPEEIRVRLVKAMISECPLFMVPPEIHILGGRAVGSKFYSQLPNVVGIDSVDPCKCALDKQVYPIVENTFEKASKQPFNFADHRVANTAMLRRNIDEFCAVYGATFE